MLAYVESELITHEMNAFDAALALMALAHLGADVCTFTPALHVIVASLGEGGRHGPYKAYEWNKMKTPTRILVGGPEVTSAFVLMGLALARRAMRRSGRRCARSTSAPSPQKDALLPPPGRIRTPGRGPDQKRAKSLKTRTFFRSGKTASPDSAVVPILI